MRNPSSRKRKIKGQEEERHLDVIRGLYKAALFLQTGLNSIIVRKRIRNDGNRGSKDVQ